MGETVIAAVSAVRASTAILGMSRFVFHWLRFFNEASTSLFRIRFASTESKAPRAGSVLIVTTEASTLWRVAQYGSFKRTYKPPQPLRLSIKFSFRSTANLRLNISRNRLLIVTGLGKHLRRRHSPEITPESAEASTALITCSSCSTAISTSE